MSVVCMLPLWRGELTLPVDQAYHAFFRARLLDGVPVAFDFQGYDDDSRELFEVPEVRAWLHELFVLTMPEALAALAPYSLGPGLAVAEACCNTVLRHECGLLTVAVNGACLDALEQAGIDPAIRERAR